MFSCVRHSSISLKSSGTRSSNNLKIHESKIRLDPRINPESGMTSRKKNGIAAKVKQPLSSMWFGIALNTGLSVAVLMESRYAFLACRIWAILTVLNGLYFIVNPKAAVGAWGAQGSTSEVASVWILIVLCSSNHSRSYSRHDTNKAFGYGTLCQLAMNIKLQLWTKENQTLQLRTMPPTLWMILNALSAAVLLLQKP